MCLGIYGKTQRGNELIIEKVLLMWYYISRSNCWKNVDTTEGIRLII